MSKYPEKSWEIGEPAELGWSLEKLKAAREYTATIDTTAAMVVVNGQVLDEWGETATRSNVHSVRKSLLSALYGPAVKDGRIDLSATMAELGIDDNEPSLTDVEKTATVRDLLTCRSGIYHASLYEVEEMREKRPERGSHAPGEFWYYNNWDFNVACTVFEQRTGTSIFQAFKDWIADPIGMEDYRVEDGEYFTGPESIHPAYPFRLTARDMARFGLLLLQKGQWNGRQIISQDWVIESTAPFSPLPPAGGYGYMWFVTTAERQPRFKILPEGSFTALGNHGQMIFVSPPLDLVAVHRVNSDDDDLHVDADQMLEFLRLVIEAGPT